MSLYAQKTSFLNEVCNHSTALKNDITNADGKFEIKISNGSYIFQVRQLGTMLKEENINLNDFLDLGVLHVIENQQILKEVVINSKKKLIERKVDRLIFNLENSIFASYLTSYCYIFYVYIFLN